MANSNETFKRLLRVENLWFLQAQRERKGVRRSVIAVRHLRISGKVKIDGWILFQGLDPVKYISTSLC
jgi:hypothetical protein